MDQDSQENVLNGDGDKQILAPAEGPRENLINTAIKFLQNPKVMSSPLYQKKAFLEKKGLTQEEIQIAVSRAGVQETSSAQITAAPPPPGYQPGVIGGAPGPVYAPLPPQSKWARARDLTFSTVIVAGVSYGIYQLFQKYVRPWLLGQSAQEARLEKLDNQMDSVQQSVDDVAGLVAKLQASMNTQQSQYSYNPNERAITDLKSDIASLKGLLLNRNQFPAPPVSATLPAWQRVPSTTVTATSSPTPLPISSPEPTNSLNTPTPPLSRSSGTLAGQPGGTDSEVASSGTAGAKSQTTHSSQAAVEVLSTDALSSKESESEAEKAVPLDQHEEGSEPPALCARTP